MATHIIKVLDPYSSYDFGGGLPIILATGTVVTDEELDDIGLLLANMRAKVRPRLIEVGTLDPEPPAFIVATEDWVLEQLALVVAGARPAIKFRQLAPAAEWTISHDRDTKPDVVLLTDSDGGERVYTDVVYTDDSTVLVQWPAPTSGWAYIQ